jgi:hypothetical protein
VAQTGIKRTKFAPVGKEIVTMKTIIFCILCILALSLQAQTNSGLHLDILVCSNKTYENCTIIRVTPAYAVVEFSGGLDKVPLAELPDSYKQKYGYDSKKAEAFLQSEKQTIATRHAAFLAAQAAIQKAQLAAVGPVQTIQIKSILDDRFAYPKCFISSGESGGFSGAVFLRNIPVEVKNFILKKKQLENDIQILQDKQIVVTSTVRNTDDPAFDSWLATQNALSDAKEAKAEKLRQMKEQLDKMETDADDYTSTIAYPTGQTYAGIPIWECAQN